MRCKSPPQEVSWSSSVAADASERKEGVKQEVEDETIWNETVEINRQRTDTRLL